MFCGLGCGAYFNTFYNAKKFFNQAEKQRLEREKKEAVTGANTNNRKNPGNVDAYRKAIEKGSKVLQLHPNSKYIDDAIMIIGKSFYHVGEFIKARRKFEELITYFPKSHYVPQARLWLGKSLIQDGDYDLALESLNALVAEEVDKGIAREAQVLLGDLYFTRREFEASIQEYTNLLKNASGKAQRINALQRTGEAYIELKDFQKAAMAFKQAVELQPELEQRYSVELNYGLMLKRLKEYERALIWFEGMTKSALTNNEMANVRLEIARIFIEMKEWEKAQITFEEIANDYPKTEYATRAYYELGKMHAGFHGDYSLAKDSFQAAESIAKPSPFYDSLRTWSLNVQEWERLRFELAVLSNAYANYDMATTDTVGEYTVEEPDEDENLFDNLLAAAPDQINPQDSTKTTVNDTIANNQLAASQADQSDQQNVNENTADQEQATGLQNTTARNGTNQAANLQNKKVKMKVSVPKNFAALEEKMLQTRNKLAELFLFQFEQSDSALVHYELLSEHFYDHEMGPHWLFLRSSLQEIKGNQGVADSLFDLVVERYPNTKYANEARGRLGLQTMSTSVDLAADLYAEAEDLFLDKQDPATAVETFRKVVESYPESEFAAKALYSIGWITEWKLNDNDEAMKLYSELQERFPRSVYANQTRAKLRAAQMAAKTEEADTARNEINKDLRVVDDNAEAIGLEKEKRDDPAIAAEKEKTDDPAVAAEKEDKPIVDPRKAKKADQSNSEITEEEDPRKRKKPKPEPN